MRLTNSRPFRTNDLRAPAGRTHAGIEPNASRTSPCGSVSGSGCRSGVSWAAWHGFARNPVGPCAVRQIERGARKSPAYARCISSPVRASRPNPDHTIRRRYSAASPVSMSVTGAATVTRVPPPGVSASMTVPWSSAARAFMPAMPEPWDGVATSFNPTPLSATSSRTCLASTRSFESVPRTAFEDVSSGPTRSTV